MVEFKEANLPSLICRMMVSPNPRIASAAKAASKGDPAGLVELYECLHETDEETFKPNTDAEMCLFEAVEMNYPPAIGTLGKNELFNEDEDGKFVPEGLDLLLKAKHMGDTGASLTLSNFWSNALKKLETLEANKYTTEGIPSACGYYALGFFYFHGIDVDKNLVKAKRFFYFSDILGCKEAHEILKRIPKRIAGEPSINELKQLAENADPDQTILLLQAAAERGDIGAFKMLLAISRENGLELDDVGLSKLCDIEEPWLTVDENGTSCSHQVEPVLSLKHREIVSDKVLKDVLDTCMESGVFKKIINYMRNKLGRTEQVDNAK